MIIRKMFKFENAHIVRFCSSKRCKTSIHGHSYRAEILLESNFLDNAGMVYDFGLMKRDIGCIIDSFDHCTTIFSGDSAEYKNDLKKHSARWIEIPLNPSAKRRARSEASQRHRPRDRHGLCTVLQRGCVQRKNGRGKFKRDRIFRGRES